MPWTYDSKYRASLEFAKSMNAATAASMSSELSSCKSVQKLSFPDEGTKSA